MIKWNKKVVSEGQETTTYDSVCGKYRIVSYDWNKYKNYTLYKAPDFEKGPGIAKSGSISALKKHTNTIM
jgi:hypothetical protein